MKPRIFVRDLSEEERQVLTAGLRSSEAFVLRRSQIVLASARGETVPRIATALSCDEQTVRHAIHAFNEQGLVALHAGSSRPHHLTTVLRADVTAEMVIALLHRSPREFDFPTSLWTLDRLVQQGVRLGWLARPVSIEAMRLMLVRLGITWKRAKHWITSPDPLYQQKKRRASVWAVGFLDEVWWSRFALPKASVWQNATQPIHLVEQAWQKADPDAKALACYGVLWHHGPAEAPLREQMALRFVDGRPVSAITIQFLDGCCTQLEAEGKRAWLLIWDNASWHTSKAVRTWIREHNLQVKQSGKGVRILPLFLPKQSPWLNPIEPKWVHGKRAIVEPNGLLTAKQLAERICAYYHCPYEVHLALPEKVS